MDDSMRAKARAVFGKEFMNVMKPKPLAKNEAVALQQRANARPIPTYKVGGAVKKPMPKVQKKADGGTPTATPEWYSNYASSILDNASSAAATPTQSQATSQMASMPPAPTVAKQPFTVGPATPTQPGFKSPNSPFGYKDDDKKFGGNNNTYNDMKGKQKGQLQSPPIDPAKIAQMMQQAKLLSQTMQNNPTQPVQAAKKGGKIMAKKSGGKVCKKADGGTAASTNEGIRNRYRDMISNEMNANRAAKVAARQDRRDERMDERAAREAARTSERAAREAAQAKQRASAEAEAAKQRAATPAQRPAPNTYANAKGASGPTPTRPGFPANIGKAVAGVAGLKKGGKAKDGLAVMIAIGKGKPIKEKATGEMYGSKKAMAKHEAAESAGMERMERMKPVKRAAGGAAKVRKGMMTQSGQITPGKRGK